MSSAIQYGFTAKARDERVGPRLLRITDIQNNAVTWSDVPFCEIGEEDKATYLLRENDLVFARTGATVGKSYLIRGVIPESVFASYLIRVRLKDDVDPRYVAHFFQSAEYWRQVGASRSGIGQPNVNGKKLAQIQIPIAPLEQQRRIVAEIEKQFSRLDEAIANLKRVKANLKRYRAAVLKAAVKGALTKRWREEHLNLESSDGPLGHGLADHVLHSKVLSQHKSLAGDSRRALPALPRGWRWSTPNELSLGDDNAIGAGPFGTIFKAKDFRPRGVPIIFLRHVSSGKYLTGKPGYMDEEKWEQLFKSYSVYGGELLVTKLGDPPGDCAIYPEAIGPAMVTPDVIRMSANPAVVEKTFLMHYINSPLAKLFVTGVAFGTTRKRLTLPLFREMPVPLPPLPEQKRIVAEVERRFSIADESEAQVDANLLRAEGLRQAILKRAFGAGSG